MNEKREMIVTIDNKDTLCNIVAIWKNKENNFIAYSDGKTDKETGLENLFISKFTNINDTINLIPIVDQQEWDYADNYLTQTLSESSDFDDAL